MSAEILAGVTLAGLLAASLLIAWEAWRGWRDG